MVRLLATILLLLMATVVFAQDATPEVTPTTSLAKGLNFPRGIAYDENGNLYVAEAGNGGETVVAELEGAQILAGLSGQVTVVAPDGTTSNPIKFLTSAFVPFEGAGLGLYRAIPAGDSLWLVLSEQQNMTVFSDAVVEVDIATGRVKNYIELFAYEAANNPDGTEEIYSNPSDVAVAADGTVYIVDTGANAVYSWTPETGLATFKAWEDGPVPTAIEFGSNGDIYVGFLGAGFAPGAGHIEHWSADGSELIHTYEGLTAVTDILVDGEDNIYAVQIAEVGETGPVPNSGSVVLVTEDGVTPVATGLNTPFGLAHDGNGTLAVSVGTAFAEPGQGAVQLISLGE